MLTDKQLVKKMLENAEVRAEYDALAEEFALLDELLRARQRAGLTQAEVAARMGTKTPTVARLEEGGGGSGPSAAAWRFGCFPAITRAGTDQTRHRRKKGTRLDS